MARISPIDFLSLVGKDIYATTVRLVTAYMPNGVYANGTLSGTATISQSNGEYQSATLGADTTITFVFLGVGKINLQLTNFGAFTPTWTVSGGKVNQPGGTNSWTASGYDWGVAIYDGTNVDLTAGGLNYHS